MSNKYIVKCSVVLPAAIYIGEEKAEQGFTLDFKKIKVAGESRKLPVSSKEGPVIQISNCWGEEETSLCTAQEAASIVMSVSTREWSANWSDLEEVFTIRPTGQDLSEEFAFSVTASEVYSSAKRGIATLLVYILNFPDIEGTVLAVDIQKVYPVQIKTFAATSSCIAIGEKTNLEWRVRNCRSCEIYPEIGIVQAEQSKEITVNAPVKYTLTAYDMIGKSTIKECYIDVEPPEIKKLAPEADIYFYPGEEVHFTWETVSSYAAIFYPEKDMDQIEKSGEKTVKPQCDTRYTITVLGYKNGAPYSKSISRWAYKTNWKKAGEYNLPAEGLRISQCNMRMWEYSGEFYIFSNNNIYCSQDFGIHWDKQASLKPEDGMSTLNSAVSLYGDCLYITGITKTNDTDSYYYQYNIAKKEFSKANMMMGENYKNGGVSAVNQGKHFYGALEYGVVNLYQQSETQGYFAPIYELECDAARMNMVSWRDKLVLALMDEKGTIEIYASETSRFYFQYEGKLSLEKDEWFQLIAIDNSLYLNTKNAFYRYETWGKDSWFHPGLSSEQIPWAGVMNGRLYLLSNLSGQQLVWEYILQ